MANQSKVTEWLIKHQDDLDLQVTKLTWIERAFPGAIDLAVSININGKLSHGRGTDFSEEVALGKAVSEAIERSICMEHNISSTGIAGHFSMELAREEALKEFIERATLVQHISRNAKLQVISGSPAKFHELNSTLNGDAHWFRLNAPVGFEVVMVIYEGTSLANSFGGVLGLGCERLVETAIKKAELECMRSVAALERSPIVPMSKDKFEQLPFIRGENRKQLMMDANYCRDFLNKIKFFENEPMSIDMGEAYFEELDFPKGLPGGCPLRFVRCQSKSKINFSVLEFVG